MGEWTDADEAAYQAQYAEYVAAPNINRNRWFALIGELIALNPQSRDVRDLRRLYQQGASRENTKHRDMLLEAMLR